jgi:hypothetical protein
MIFINKICFGHNYWGFYNNYQFTLQRKSNLKMKGELITEH